MSAVEVRELARAVIDAGGGLDDLKRLIALWEARARQPEDEPVAPCGCRQRPREWRLVGPAVDLTCNYLSGKAYRAAAAQPTTARRGVIAKGPASGWAWKATPLGHGHGWTCLLCHPPARGLDVEYRDARDVEALPA